MVPTKSRTRPGTIRELRGFTAIELMVVVAILGILAALAAPSFQRTIWRYQVRSATEDLIASTYLARTEAIKRGGGVVLRQNSSTDCTPSAPEDWSCGWLLFVDSDTDGELGDSESVLQESPRPRGVTVKRSSQSAHQSFNAWGESGAGMDGFTLNPTAAPAADDTVKARLCISSGGRIKHREGTSSCD